MQLEEDVTVESRSKEKEQRRRRFMGKAAAASQSDSEDAMRDEDGDGAIGEEGEGFMSSKMSRRILDEARKQQMEEDEDPEFTGKSANTKKRVTFGGAVKGSSSRNNPASAILRGKDDEEEEEEEEIIEFGADEDVRLDGEYVDARLDGYDMDERALASEDAILRKFMPDAPGERRTLADIIMEKLKEKEEEAAGVVRDDPSARPALDAKIIEVYTEVGRYLSHYKSGKMPKVFKVIPGLSNWEEILFLTNPETWTPHATYAATRIFASNFNAAKAQRFFNLILLPKCRDDVYYNKKLNYHLYLALKKATYKPAAFYKGIILPLAAERDATLREAIIFGSVISKVSLPQLHSAATLIKLCGMDYNGAISVLLKILINKKYTLPYMAIDALADHFAQFTTMNGPMPVIWHQSLLAFAQRYKADLTHEQKDTLREVMSLHNHHSITPEIRRELFSVGCRGEAVPAAAAPVPAPAKADKTKKSSRGLSTMEIEY